MNKREQYQGQPAEGFKPLEEWGGVEALSDEELEAWRRSPVTSLESRVIATVARLQAHIKVLDERRMQASLYVRLCHERDALQARVEEAEALAERRKKAWERVDLAVRTGVDPATANGPPENAAFFSKDELIAYIGLEARAAIEEEAHPG